MSTQVILGRMSEAGAFSWDQFLAELGAKNFHYNFHFCPAPLSISDGGICKIWLRFEIVEWNTARR